MLTSTGQYDLALEHLGQAFTLAVERDDYDAQARVSRWLARMYELRGEYLPALNWIQQGLDTLEGRETAEAAQLMFFAGLIHTRQGD